MKTFALRYGAGPFELWSTEAGDKLVGQTTTVKMAGEQVRAKIATAEVVDEGRGLELTLEVLEPSHQPTHTTDAIVTDPCARKIAFETEQLAKDELARIIKRSMIGERRRGRHIETGFYRCPKCRRWHLSSRPWKGIDGKET